jgi:hypothetical protein
VTLCYVSGCAGGAPFLCWLHVFVLTLPISPNVQPAFVRRVEVYFEIERFYSLCYWTEGRHVFLLLKEAFVEVVDMQDDARGLCKT